MELSLQSQCFFFFFFVKETDVINFRQDKVADRNANPVHLSTSK